MEKKSYPYILEKYYYTNPEHIPNDPHWTVVANLNHFLDKNNQAFEIKTNFKNMEVLDSLPENQQQESDNHVNNCNEPA